MARGTSFGSQNRSVGPVLAGDQFFRYRLVRSPCKFFLVGVAVTLPGYEDRGVARPGHTRGAGYFALPSAALIPSYRNGVQVNKSVYSYFLQHKEVSQTSILGPVDRFCSAGVCCALIRIIITSCAKTKSDRSGLFDQVIQLFKYCDLVNHQIRMADYRLMRETAVS